LRAEFRRALAINPDFAEAHNNLGVILGSQRRFDEAILHFEQALAAHAGYAETHNNFSLALASMGRRTEAITHFQRALAIRRPTARTPQQALRGVYMPSATFLRDNAAWVLLSSQSGETTTQRSEGGMSAPTSAPAPPPKIAPPSVEAPGSPTQPRTPV
jgi:tetratricopeptide (TPR) repeat protein